MKKVIVLITGCIFTIGAIAQQDNKYNQNKNQNPNQGENMQDTVKSNMYCAMLKDGKILLMQDDKPVETEIPLNEGARVTTGGTVIKEDGSIVVLNNGDCIDMNGNISNMPGKGKKPSTKEGSKKMK